MPTFGFAGTGRTAPYDRAPASVSKVYSAAGVAPHGETTRFTYTVPAGKLALVASVVASAVRVTAAAPVGYAFAAVKLNDGTVNAPIVIAAEIGNTVDSDARMNGTPQLVALAGTVITGTTADGSTGGTFNYELGAIIYEFTA